MKKSWGDAPQKYRERAIDIVRRNVALYRWTGEKTPAALTTMAPILGITHRRARTLFERDGEPLILADELRRIMTGSINLRRLLATRLRAKADQLDRECEELALQNRQLSLWEDAGCRGSGGGALPQRRAA